MPVLRPALPDEAMFQQICQSAIAGGEEHLNRLNEGLAAAGFKSKKFEKFRRFDSKDYERLSFLGHELLHLLKQGSNGQRNIAIVLNSNGRNRPTASRLNHRAAYIP